MNIANLSATNFRGGSFSHELAPVTLIHGNNAAGKTRIFAAARTVLLGYDPDLGKKGMHDGMLDGEIKELEATLSDGRVYSHRWQKKDGGVSHKCDGDFREFNVPIELLDLNEYLYETTAAERIKMVFGKLRLDEFDDAALIESFHKIEALPAAVALPLATALEREVSGSIVDRVKFGVQIQVWLDKLIQKLRDRRKITKEEERAATATIVALKARVGAPNAKDVSATLDKLKASLREADTNRAMWEAQWGRWIKSQSRREQLQQQLRGTDAATMDHPLPELKGALWEQREVLKTYLSNTARLRGEWEALKARCEASHQTQQRQLDAIAALEREIAGIKAERFCAKCEAKVLAGREKSLEHLWNATKPMKEESEIRLAQARKIQAQLKRSEAADKTHVEHRDRADALERVITLRMELESLGGSKEPDQAAGKQIADTVAKLQNEVAALEQQQQLFVAARDLTQRRNAAEAESVKAAVTGNVLDQALAILIKAQSDVVATAFEGLLEDARLFTDGILRSPLAYRDGELGRWEGETFVSHEAFSGTEKLLAYAGLSYALAAQSPIKLVLLDEMARLTKANKALVMERLLQLVRDGRLDQALCVDTTAEDYGAFVKRVSFIEVV